MRLVTTCNKTQRRHLIFPVIAPTVKSTLKPINSCIRTWFQISPHLTKQAQEWVYSHKTSILLLSLNMFYSLLAFLSRSAGVGTRRATISSNLQVAPTFHSPSNSKHEVCHRHSISRRWHHGCKNFGFLAIWKPENALSRTFCSHKSSWKKVEFCIVFVIIFLNIA